MSAQQDGPADQAPFASDNAFPADLESPTQTNFEWKKLVPGLVVSLVSIIIILMLVNPQEVKEELEKANPALIAGSALLSLLWLAVRGFFWRTLLLNQASYRSVFLSINEGYILNNLLPFRLGEIGRALLLARKSSLTFWKIIPSIIIERSLDIGMTVVLFFGSLPFITQAASANNLTVLVSAAAVTGLFVLYVLARKPEIVRKLADSATRKMPALHKLINRPLDSFIEGISILADNRRFLVAVFWLLINWGISALQVTLLLRAFVPEAPVLWAFFILGCTALGNAAPSTPGSLGVGDLAITTGLIILNIDPATATAYAVLTRLINYLSTGVIGSFALSQEKISLRALFVNLYNRSRGRGVIVRILVALTYYRPYTSGLTLYAERVARALLAMGHQVTIVTSRHDPALPAEEVLDGVRVFRANVAFRISKGPVMPGMLFLCWKLMQSADLIHLHLPQLDAAGLAIMGRLLGKRVVSTYHCDLQLPTGIINRMANWGVTLANHIAASLSDRIATNTLDYAEHSSLLRRYLGKVTQIYPPAVIQPPTQADFAAVIKKADIQPDEIIIGMAARLASEKGVEYMIEALPIIQQTYPQARVLFVGAYQNVPGEEMYAQKLAPMIAKLGASWRFLGLLEDREFAAFLSSCAVTVLPSLNSTESFGMVQIESMLCGVPVVTTDLPGVRQPVRLTGMGRIIPKANAQALADAVLDVLEQKKSPQPGQPAPVSQDQLNRLFSPHQVALQYDALFQETL